MALQLPTVKLENFEGPFDLLLELTRRRKLDVSEISLRSVTKDFLSYIQKEEIPERTKGDFLVVASTLLLIKIRNLLPRLSPEEKEEIEDLEGKVRVYDLYREQAEVIQKRWGLRKLLPAGFWAEGVEVNRSTPLTISSTDINNAFQDVIKKLPKPVTPRAHLRKRGRSLHECLALFQSRLKQVHKLVFQEAVRGVDKQEAAVSFLAVLEMARSGEVTLEQKEAFDLLIVSHE